MKIFDAVANWFKNAAEGSHPTSGRHAAGSIDGAQPDRGTSYAEHFAHAEAVSQRFARAKPMQLHRPSMPPSRLQAGLVQVVQSEQITEEDYRAGAGQCLKWAHYLAPALQRALGVDCWPTLGQLWKGPTKLWGPTWPELESWMTHGIDPVSLAFAGAQGVNVHAWLTLATGDIVDITLGSTLAAAWNQPELVGNVSFGHPDRDFPSTRYVPMLVGSAAVEHLQSKTSVPLLTTERAGLTERSYLLVAHPDGPPTEHRTSPTN